MDSHPPAQFTTVKTSRPKAKQQYVVGQNPCFGVGGALYRKPKAGFLIVPENISLDYPNQDIIRKKEEEKRNLIDIPVTKIDAIKLAYESHPPPKEYCDPEIDNLRLISRSRQKARVQLQKVKVKKGPGRRESILSSKQERSRFIFPKKSVNRDNLAPSAPKLK